MSDISDCEPENSSADNSVSSDEDDGVVPGEDPINL